MRIAIDARFLGPEGGGIGKYTEKLLENLETTDRENEYFVILRRSNFPRFNPRADNFVKLLADIKYYSVHEQLLLPAVLARLKPDLVHFPHFNVPLAYPGKFVVTIHDMIKTEFKGASSTTRRVPMYLIKHLAYEISIQHAIRKAGAIIVPSHYVRKALTSHFGLAGDRVAVTYEAADELFGDKDGMNKGQEILAKYGIKKPFILYVGAAFPYKNLEKLLQALSYVKRIDLVYTGGRDVFVAPIIEKARQFGVEGRLTITGIVPNEDLALLYKLASCLVFPSLSEGFGLPGLEAMASGCPVVCSNIEVFREVYSDAAVYFDPDNSRDIAEKIGRVLHDLELRRNLIQNGFEQAGKYSWRKLAQETLGVYERLRLDNRALIQGARAYSVH